ncbi:hypothetical protein L209DRAFT_745957 [Thermothelomyces heterothallicus CBS 203.75]
MRRSAVALGALATQAAARYGHYENPPFSFGGPTVELPTPTSADPGQGAPDAHPSSWTTSTAHATGKQTPSDGGTILTTVTMKHVMKWRNVNDRLVMLFLFLIIEGGKKSPIMCGQFATNIRKYGTSNFIEGRDWRLFAHLCVSHQALVNPMA